MNIYDFGRDDDDVESDILQYLYVDVSCVREGKDPESRTWSRSLESGHYLTIPPKKEETAMTNTKKKDGGNFLILQVSIEMLCCTAAAAKAFTATVITQRLGR